MANDKHIAGEEIVIREKVVGFGFDIRKGWPLVLLLIAVVVGAFALVWPSGEREPVYQGKKLSEWIENADQIPAAGPGRAEREEAVRHIGTNALPFLIKWVREGATASKLDSMLDALNRKARRLLFKPRYRDNRLAWEAVWAFQILGDTARPAIPELVKLTQSSNDYISTLATMALYSVGTNVTPALLVDPASGKRN